MSFQRAGQLARQTPTARPDDSLGLVAENLRESRCATIPVLDRVVIEEVPASHLEARVLGLIDERDLSRAVLPALEQRETLRREIHSNGLLAATHTLQNAGQSTLHTQSTLGAQNNGHAPPMPAIPAPQGHPTLHDTPAQSETMPTETAQLADVSGIAARDVMRSDVGIVPAAFSLHNALLMLDRYDCNALPVIDEAGRYRGMISRADVVAALGGQARPPVVGGMATPLGVWLTTGTLSAGAPPLGLFLSGLMLAACFIVTEIILQLGLSAFNVEWGRMFASGRLGATANGGVLNFFITLAHSGVFLLLLRALPMSGIHAAEHQTVWAIERGLPLTPEYVARMPRAHPRCGTNLMALAGLILIIFAHLPNFDSTSILISLIFIYFAWRTFGTALQQYLTTKPATPKQLESGLRAGRELLEKYQSQPHVELSFGARLWNSGILLSFAGFLVLQTLYDWAKNYFVTAWLP